jgi:hypothetical protein
MDAPPCEDEYPESQGGGDHRPGGLALHELPAVAEGVADGAALRVGVTVTVAVVVMGTGDHSGGCDVDVGDG